MLYEELAYATSIIDASPKNVGLKSVVDADLQKGYGRYVYQNSVGKTTYTNGFLSACAP